ncbi:LOW QUALITY PROTEIN: NXPE family member 4-like [Mantella aurantiaca]
MDISNGQEEYNRTILPQNRHTQENLNLDVINLSQHNLAQEESEVLSLGLTFCPNKNIDKFTIVKDIHLFDRKLTYKTHFEQQNTGPPELPNNNNFSTTKPKMSKREYRALKDLMELWEESNSNQQNIEPPSTITLATPSEPKRPSLSDFKAKSTKFPPFVNSNLAFFVRQVTTEINSLKITQPKNTNLTSKQSQALSDLQHNSSIVIKPSDKGGNIVIMDKDNYVQMCNKILDNTTWYSQVSLNYVEMVYEKFYVLVDDAYTMGNIDKQLWDFLRTAHPKLPTFYALLKTHKNLTNPPGRPIVSGMGCISEQLSKVVDFPRDPGWYRLMWRSYNLISGAVLYSNKPTVNHMEKRVTFASLSLEDAIQASLIFKNISILIPSIKFSRKDNTTSARKSRATILNPRKKYCVGETIIVQIAMFDHLGNRKTYGGDFIRARMFSPNLKAAASGRIEDFSNGTYYVHFTLFWEGKVYFSLVLYHPSEAVSALRARNWAYGLIYFTGTFTNGTHQEKSECGFQLSAKKAICEYRNEEYNELFYCTKPDSFHCGSLIYLQSFNRDISFLSPFEKSLLNRENIAVEIPKNFESIGVYSCTKSSFPSLEQCKIGMVPSFPSGFVLQNKWRPVFCRLANFTLHEQMYTCLKDKIIYLMGDSTVRQWHLYLAKTFKGLKRFDLHRSGLESMLLAVDLQSNIKLQWKKHSHPIVASRFYSVKDDRYVSEQIDHLDGGPHYVIVICLGQHFRAFPIHLFIQRVINVRKALERLFIRSPDTKVIIKSENTREMSIDPERFSDFHGYIQYLIVKDIFKDLPVAVIDAWDMTIAYNTNNVHPPDSVIQDQTYMFLTYIC